MPRTYGKARTLLRMLGTSALTAAVVTSLHARGWFDEIEHLWVDFVSIMYRPAPSSEVVLVAITDSDFASRFNSTSPLDPGVVAALIDRLDTHKPNTVVIDMLLHPTISETGERTKGRHELLQTLRRVAAGSATRWILVHVPVSEPERKSWDHGLRLEWEALEHPSAKESLNLHWASAQIELDRGVVRYIRTASDQSVDNIRLLTLFGEAANEAAPLDVSDAHGEMRRLIRYTGRFIPDGTSLQVVSAGVVLDSFPRNAPPNDTSAPSMLHDKKIVLGGTHTEGRDSYWTPLGAMPAASIWAEALDSAKRNSPRPISYVAAFAIETALGVAAGALMLWYGPVVGWLLAATGLAVLTILATAISFAWGFAFISGIPSFWAVQWHQRIELWRENRDLRRRLYKSKGATNG